MRVACYQSGTEGISGDGQWSGVMERCAADGVDLLVTPEFAVGGLPHTATAARDRSLPSAEAVLPWAADAPAGLTAVIGFTERSGTRLHSSAAVLRDGRVRAVARKLHPREPGLAPGGGSPIFDVAGMPCGIVICADATHEGPARQLAVAGARLLVCLLNNDMSVAHAAEWADRTDRALSDRARESRCWVVSADVAGTAPGRRALAATRIHAPDGELLSATAAVPGELLVADIG